MSVPKNGDTQPSAIAATLVNAAGTSPPSSTGTRPAGSAGIGPAAPDNSPRHTARMVASVVSNLAARPESGMSLAA